MCDGSRVRGRALLTDARALEQERGGNPATRRARRGHQGRSKRIATWPPGWSRRLRSIPICSRGPTNRLSGTPAVRVATVSSISPWLRTQVTWSGPFGAPVVTRICAGRPRRDWTVTPNAVKPHVERLRRGGEPAARVERPRHIQARHQIHKVVRHCIAVVLKLGLVQPCRAGQGLDEVPELQQTLALERYVPTPEEAARDFAAQDFLVLVGESSDRHLRRSAVAERRGGADCVLARRHTDETDRLAPAAGPADEHRWAHEPRVPTLRQQPRRTLAPAGAAVRHR